MACRIGVIDYKTSNINSVVGILKLANADVKVVSDLHEFENFDKIVLPGVGSFGSAIDYLKNSELDKEIIREANNNKYILGICLGMQLLADYSEESPLKKGLGLIPGKVKKINNINSRNFRIPHIGWNEIKKEFETPILKNISDAIDFYFVHSYYLDIDKKYVVARTMYCNNFCSVVQKNNIIGCQFHPEKSLKSGLKLIKNFVDL